MPRCASCGRELGSQSTFCPWCGTRVASLGAPPRPQPPRRPGPLAALGAAVVVAGAFLPWLGLEGVNASGWQLSASGIIAGRELARGVTVGAVLLVCAAGAIPYATGRPLPGRMAFVLGSLAMTVAGMALVRGLVSDPALAAGPGLVMATGGGVLMMLGDVGAGPRLVVPAVLVLTAAGAAVAAVPRAPGPEPAPAPATRSPTRSFTDDETGVRILVPSVWKDARSPTGAIGIFDPATSPDGSAQKAEAVIELSLDDAPDGDLAEAATTRLKDDPPTASSHRATPSSGVSPRYATSSTSRCVTSLCESSSSSSGDLHARTRSSGSPRIRGPSCTTSWSGC